MKSFLKIAVFSITLVSIGFAQQGNQQQAGGKVVNIGPIKLDVRIELPQVQILDKRISPDFEDVKAEKRFENEIVDRREYVKFKPITSMKVKPIKNVQALLNKKRF